ncbi:MAG: glycosyltransferase [Desulfurococcales archaeon]|nr:glycosyltransferase [Desulfurococcales archaeon]
MTVSVAILHYPWETIGGSEKLSLTLFLGLLKNGVDARLLTSASFDPEEVSKVFGVKVPQERVEILNLGRSLSDSILSRFTLGAYARGLLQALRISGFLDTFYSDEVVVAETHLGFPLPADIVYMHYPTMAWKPRARNILWLAYRYFVRLLERRLGLPWGRGPGVLVTNSKWTASLIYRVHRRLAQVIYPPVDFTWVPSTEGSEKLALSITRFTPTKNVHKLLKSRLDTVGYRLHLVGGARKPVEKKYLAHIEALARSMAWVSVHPNAPREVLVDLLRKARYYIHVPFPEHFGIAVAESMAAGLVPIVYCDGGAWIDLVKPSGAGACYRDPREIPGIIKSLESSWDSHSEKARLYVRSQLNLTPEHFIKKMLLIIRNINDIKRQSTVNSNYS